MSLCVNPFIQEEANMNREQLYMLYSTGQLTFEELSKRLHRINNQQQ